MTDAEPEAPEAEAPEAPEAEAPKAEPPVEVVAPKRRGRPPGAKNKPKPVVVEPEPEPEPEPELRQEDVSLATRYLARQLGQLGAMSLEAKRARWRELFM